MTNQFNFSIISRNNYILSRLGDYVMLFNIMRGKVYKIMLFSTNFHGNTSLNNFFANKYYNIKYVKNIYLSPTILVYFQRLHKSSVRIILIIMKITASDVII